MRRPNLIQNQFGASLGGPIKRDKTFFFVNWEEYRNRNGAPTITTVPTVRERSGDFSQTRNAAGNVIAIADPLTTRQLPDGSYVRDVFPGNIISEFPYQQGRIERSAHLAASERARKPDHEREQLLDSGRRGHKRASNRKQA